MNFRTYRKQWLKWHGKYELRAYRLIRKRLREQTLKIPFNEINENNFSFYFDIYLTKRFFQDLFLEIYTEIGVLHGKRVGKFINNQINQKNLFENYFDSQFLVDVQRYLLRTYNINITTVQETYREYLLQIISNGFIEGKPLPEVVKDLQRVVKSRNFYKYQAFRIARTESTSASNYSAFSASNSLGIAMDKVWLSSQDKRTRRTPPDKYDHFHMNNVRVPLNEPFLVSGEKLMFPGDQENGSAGNVINCRCTMVQVVRKDKQGNIIYI